MPSFEVLMFAGLRQALGSEVVHVDLAPASSVADLLRTVASVHPGIADLVRTCRVAVDHEFVSSAHPLHGGEEVALIPPVSGGHDGVERIALLDRPLCLTTVVAAVEHAGAGGIATFTGMVRRHSRGLEVEYLDYEAYAPMARQVMAQIAAQAETASPGARVAIHHRIGRLMVGELAVVIAASAPHRAEAFAACRAAIEALKRDVPIWKREVSTDGAEWIGHGP